MILENGRISTGDAQLPTVRALAIAGDRVAGGVGVHETALPSPEVVDLDGRVVLPGRTETGAIGRGDVEALRAAANELAARGVTCVHDTSGALAAWQELRARTLLPVRVRVLVSGEAAATLSAHGIRSGFGDDLVRVVFGEFTVDEEKQGRLLPGYLVDLVVLDDEETPFATMLGGRWVHNPPPWPARTR